MKDLDVLDLGERSEIILGVLAFFNEVLFEAVNIKDDNLVGPFKEMGPDEKFLDYMDLNERRIFSLFVYYKTKKQKEKMEKIKIVLMTLTKFRLLDKKIDFTNCKIHFRKGFQIVSREEKSVPYSQKIK